MGRCEREVEGYMELIRDAATEGKLALAQNHVETLTSLLALRSEVSKMGAIAAELDQLGLHHTINQMIEAAVGRAREMEAPGSNG